MIISEKTGMKAMRNQMLYHGKMKNPLAKIMNLIGWTLAIVFSYGGSFLTVLEQSIVPVLICFPAAILSFRVFHYLAIQEERKGGKNQRATQIVRMEEASGNDTVTIDPHVTFGEKVTMKNPCRGITKVIIENRSFCNFPGIEEDERWLSEWTSKNLPENWVRFRTTLTPCEDGTSMVIWTIQPDGRYWADENGFGWENDSEVCLYSVLDARGNFLYPFRLYSIGSEIFYKN